MIIDSQVHIWNRTKPGVMLRSHLPGPPGPFTAERLLAMMAEARVDKAILVPPSAELDGNDVVLAAARAHPNRFAVMGQFDANAPGMQEKLARCRDEPGMLGFRLVLRGESACWLDAPQYAWIWRTAEAAGIPLMLFAPGLLGEVEAIARRHPALRLAIDHCAIPVGTLDDAVTPFIDALLPLSSLPNVAVKVSAMARYSSQPYPFAPVHAHIRRVVEAFGPDRAFWGADISTLQCSYTDVVRLFTEALGLSPSDKALIMGKALARWLRWEA
jgi:L-fuconolactonase